MDDFETFKASREKMDPTSRKMNDHQWQQAYSAYLSARERVSGGAGSEVKVRKRSRGKRSSTSSSRSHRPSGLTGAGQLRRTVRDQSAYADLRLIVDILAWVAVGVLVLAGVLTVFYYTSVPATLASMLGTAVQIIGIVVGRMLVQVLIDIPDIALYRALRESASGQSASAQPED